MANTYDWHPTGPERSVFKVDSQNLGWWVLLALFISLCIHIALYYMLATIERGRLSGAVSEEEIVWRPRREQLVIDQNKLSELLAEPIVPEETAEIPEKKSDLDLTNELDEFDLLEQAKDEVIRMSPIETPQIFSPEAPKAPGQALEIAANDLNISAAEMLSKDLDAMRSKLIDSSAAVAENQPVLELSQNTGDDTGVDTDQFFRDAAARSLGNGAAEVIKGYTSLDDLVSRGGAGGGTAIGDEKIALPTDILFGFNEFALKEEARLSMMKLAFVVQTNPKATFTIEGHTDSIGGEDFNKDLSLKRATAVRDWLVERLRIDAGNIQVIGLGKSRPLVPITGDAEQEALNRRVEIVIKQG